MSFTAGPKLQTQRRGCSLAPDLTSPRIFVFGGCTTSMQVADSVAGETATAEIQGRSPSQSHCLCVCCSRLSIGSSGKSRLCFEWALHVKVPVATEGRQLSSEKEHQAKSQASLRHALFQSIPNGQAIAVAAGLRYLSIKGGPNEGRNSKKRRA